MRHSQGATARGQVTMANSGGLGLNARFVGLCMMIGSASLGCSVDSSLFIGGRYNDAGAAPKDSAAERSAPSDEDDAAADAEEDASNSRNDSDVSVDSADVETPMEAACVAQ